MADTIKGVIEKVVTRGNDPSKPMYSFVINKVWYGSGRIAPPDAGTEVEFTAFKNDAGYWAAKNIKPTGNKAADTNSVQGGNSSRYTPKSQEEKDYWLNKNKNDEVKEAHYRARWAVSQGTEAALKAAAAGLVKHPAKANEEEKREQVLTLGFDLATIMLEKANSLAQPKGVKVVKPITAPESETPPNGEASKDESWNEEE